MKIFRDVHIIFEQQLVKCILTNFVSMFPLMMHDSTQSMNFTGINDNGSVRWVNKVCKLQLP